MPTDPPRLKAQDAALERFNRACRLVALAWLVIALPVSLWIRPTYQDLSGIYIGGLVARLGAWEALYPIPSADPSYYVGEKGQGIQKPLLLDIASDHGVREVNPYLNPPWQAWVLLPLGWLTFQQAHWVVVGINILCTWGVAMAAGRGFDLAAGRRSWAAGGVVLLVACSPLAYRSIRVQNLSPMVAYCIAIATWDLLKSEGRSGFVGGLAIAVGGLIKIATGALIPLSIAMRRWRLLGWAAGLTILAVALTWSMAGTSTFREFFGSIAPTLAYSSTNLGNKSLQGFLLRATGRSPLPRALGVGFQLLRLGTLSLILWILFRRRPVSWQMYWNEPAHVFAASVALLSWLLIFTPLCWEHYFMYLCPFWGWLLWEGTRSRGRMIASATAIALHWFPLPTLRWLTLREPMNSYMLVGTVLMLGIAVFRLGESGSERPGV